MVGSAGGWVGCCVESDNSRTGCLEYQYYFIHHHTALYPPPASGNASHSRRKTSPFAPHRRDPFPPPFPFFFKLNSPPRSFPNPARNLHRHHYNVNLRPILSLLLTYQTSPHHLLILQYSSSSPNHRHHHRRRGEHRHKPPTYSP